MDEKRNCPHCGGKLKQHGTRNVGSLIERRRDCTNCDYGDKTLAHPEKIISILPVLRRRTSDQTQSTY